MTSYLLLMQLLFLPSPPQISSDQDLVRLFYPPVLSTWVRENPGAAEHQQWCSALADFDRTGTQNYLVVAYSNGHIGRLRIIKKTPAGPVLVADPDSPALYEDYPSLQLIDLNHDERPEILITFHIGNHGETATWVFGWDGTNIRPLNPADPDSPQNVIAFRTPDFVDLDGDGTLEIVEPSDTYGVHEEFATPEESHPVVPDRTSNIYQMRDGRFSMAMRSVPYYGSFSRGKGEPKPIEESFTAKPGNYVLRIANGENGRDLVDSAEIQTQRRSRRDASGL